MTEHERNFRTHFYEKVGFRGIEEKKSIEVLLSEQPIDKEKLRNFCCRYGVPALYRIYVWKVLLGVLPLYSSNQDFVWNQRKAQVRELERAHILLASEFVDVSVPQKMMKMKLIEEGTLPLEDKVLDSEPDNQYYFSIARATNGLVTSDVDLYWVSTRFFRYISKSVYPSLHLYRNYSLQVLRQEDQDQRLFQHLSDHLVLSALPFSEWFHICFSNVLPEGSLEVVWDRVIGGCSAILIYVAVAILLVLKRPLMAMHTTHDMLNILKKIPDDCGDKIVNEAVELLHKYGGQEPGKCKTGSISSTSSSCFDPRDRGTSTTSTGPPVRHHSFFQDNVVTNSGGSEFRDRLHTATCIVRQPVGALKQDGGNSSSGDFRDRINSSGSGGGGILRRHDSLDSSLTRVKRPVFEKSKSMVGGLSKKSSGEKLRKQQNVCIDE